MTSVTDKLHPQPYAEGSRETVAIIALVLGEKGTDLAIRWISAASDRCATTDSDFLGDVAVLDRIILKSRSGAQLYPGERRQPLGPSRARVDDDCPALEQPDDAELH